jgi:hypothetical protein
MIHAPQHILIAGASIIITRILLSSKNIFGPHLTIFIVNIMSDTSSAATTVSDTAIDTTLICIAHCPFQKGRAFGLSNI